MFQILAPASPIISDWSQLPDADDQEMGKTCSNNEPGNNEHNESSHNPITDTRTSLPDSTTLCNTTETNSGDCVDETAAPQNTECLSSTTASRVRDPRKAPLGVISEGISVDHVSNELCSDMAQLKATTARLKLATRRPSYVAWQARVKERPEHPPRREADLKDDILTDEKKEWITNALEWITDELKDMRHQDQDLARQLLTIRQEIQRLKLTMSCEFHQDMMADVQLEMEELEELAEICDKLPTVTHDNPLRHLGVTRMNISARRFSTC